MLSHLNSLIRSKSKLVFNRQLWVLAIVISIVSIRILVTGSSQDEKLVRLTGMVTTNPKIGFNSTQFQVQGYFVTVNGTHYEIEDSDIVTIEGIANGRLIKKATILQRTANTSFFTITRNKALSIIKSTFHEPESSLLAGILFGESSNTPKSLKEQLVRSGTIHLFVASGTNIAVVSSILFMLISRLTKRNNAVLFSIVGTWAYAGFVGFQAPIVRAALVATIVFSTQYIGIVVRPITALFWTLAGMLFIYPVWGYDISFYLSAAATLGILTLEPFIYRFISKYIVRYGVLKKELSVSLAAQIAVSPLLFLVFHQMSPMGILSTILVSWIIFPVTILGFIGLLMYIVSPLISFYLLLLVIPFLKWFLIVVNVLS